ncbi:spermidine/putrescine transport system substrate-binding protein [Desulfomicrobium macestii]|uniref:Spermidine/putrescine transport system substrate-binding protein n=1 Tax=Desulfomicrobium macestii TaxID=90731 RepID=A0ABR9H522_9BACT|nr:extracellular solute-binding protein [Desulfomicrobium macestii]MBE1425812.1 spermidine/putrescine transport system substrate-binding protein [Desulfomicrobium macestii]
MKRLVLTVLCLMLATQVLAASKELYVYNWSEYMPDSVLEDFTKETGVKVIMSTYDSNEALYAKIRMVEAKGYDIIVPSTDFVARMHKEGLLMKLDKSKLSNLGNLNPKLMNQSFDPDNNYSVPYMWGSTAIAVNTKDPAAASVTSFADLWKPELAGKILLPNDMRGVLGMGLKRLGYSLNETDPAKVAEACELLQPLMSSVRVFDSDSPKQAMLNNEVQAAVLWNGEAYIATGENPDIRYIYPTEGYSLWIDNLCIPKNAGNADNAHLFIDYLLRPEVAAFICQEMGYSTPNLAAQAILPEDVRGNAIVYPGAEDMARGEFETDLGPAVKAYEECWMRLKTR